VIRRLLRLRNAIVLAVALAAAGTLAPAPVLAAGPSGGFSVRPAHVDPADPASRAYFKPVVAPGGSFVDQVLVGNTSDAPVDLIVSSVDGRTGATSGAVYANREEPATKAGSWVVPNGSFVRVAPHTEMAVGFDVHVPIDATPGDHLAGIAFEDAHPRSSGKGFAVTQVIRAVVGVLIQVPGPAQFHARVDGVDLAPLPGVGASAMMIRLGDDGSKLAKPLLAVSLSGPAGYQRDVGHQLDTVLPGDTIPFPLPWPDTLQPGDYDVLVTVTGGPEPVVFRGRIHLGATMHSLRTPKHAAGNRKASETSWLLLLAAGIGGGLLGAVFVRRPRRRLRTDASAREPLEPPVPAMQRRPAKRRERDREPTG
jgi:hypothetical protein